MIIAFGFAAQSFLSGNYILGIFGGAIGLFFLLQLINSIRTYKQRKSGNCDKGCELTEWLKGIVRRLRD